MDAIITHPAFQSGIAPFLVALGVALLLRPLSNPWKSIGLMAGFGVSVYLVVGWQLLPLTSTRKIFIIAALLTLLGVLLDLYPALRDRLLHGVVAAGVVSVVWVIWPLLQRQEDDRWWPIAGAALLFSTLLTGSLRRLKRDNGSLSVALCGVALGLSGAALMGASLLYAQLAAALCGGAAAYLLLSLWHDFDGAGEVLLLPSTALLALIAVAAVLFAQVPWYSLLPLLTIPLLVSLPLPLSWATWQERAAQLGLVVLPITLTIVMVWSVEGSPPL
ncbi:MAG: hypothetical protein FD130_202 [Halothiobacillaceae bacterium]|nr:MAG: hypothetical protein FD130_202 [Halothiobacillaceae bacterium]